MDTASTHTTPDQHFNGAERCSTLVEILRWRAEHEAERTAYTFLVDGETQEESITYKALDERSRMIGGQLQSMSAAGERVLLLYPPGLAYIAAFFGCLYAGAIAVPAYPPRPGQALSHIESLAADCQAAFALTSMPVMGLIGQQASTGALNGLGWVVTDHLPADAGANWSDPGATGNTLALLQYTSGSTGDPKGVMVTHANLIHNAATMARLGEHTSGCCSVIWAPPYHNMGLIGGILQAFYAGFPCFLMSPVSFLQNPFRWLQAISRYRATTSGGSNFAYDLCVRKITPEQRATLDLSSWTVAFTGGEPVRKEILDEFAEAFAPCGFRPEAYYACYGLSENTLCVAGGLKSAPPVIAHVEKAGLELRQIVEVEPDSPHGMALVGNGQTLTDQQIVIVDPKSLVKCAPNEVGEIWVSGLSVALGYWKRPEETAETFQAYLSDTGEGPFLRTGDLGFLRDGELFITGRMKDLIIIRGRNHYPQDIELTVERSHPALKPGCGAAVSVAVDGEERLMIVQELHPDYTDVTAAIGAIRQAVGQHHQVSVHTVVLVRADTTPKTISGKIQRQACKESYLSGSLDVVLADSMEASTMTPGSQANFSLASVLALPPEERQMRLESYVCEQIARAAKIAPSLVNPQHSLVSTGVDSLAVIELTTAFEQSFGVALAMSSVMQGMTIRELATQVLERLALDTPASNLPIQPLPNDGDLPLSFGQEGLWFLNQVDGLSSAYNLPFAVRISGALNTAALEAALNEIVRRHDLFRVTFATVNGEPVQRVAPSLALSMPVVDLRTVASDQREEQIRSFMTEEARRPFALDQDPPIRVSLLHVGSDRFILLATVHHIISDAWSMGVFGRELAALYEAYADGKPSPLSDLPIQYQDWAAWHRQWLSGARLADQLSYWKRQLEGMPSLLALPTDRSRAAQDRFRGSVATFVLPMDLVEALKSQSREEGVTLFMTLLTAFNTLLHRYSGQEEVVVGCPIAGRNRAESSDLIGLFVNTLVLRNDLSGNPTFRETLQRVKKVALAAYDHHDVPFSKLVELLQPSRSGSYTPLLQAVFTLQDVSVADMQLPGLRTEALRVHHGGAAFDLTLDLSPTHDGLLGMFEYNAELFDVATIQRMISHFRTLLEGISGNPGMRLSDLPLLGEGERQQLLVEWNSTRTDYPCNNSIHELFQAQARRTPEAVALVFGEVALTYRDLNLRANQVAHSLKRLGVGPETLVGICVERSVEMVVGILGILKAGGAYVPLDPSHPKERLAFVLSDARVPVLITQARLVGSLPDLACHLLCLDADWHRIAAEQQENPGVGVTGESLAYVMYTSGSTGKPKGVAVSHRAVSRLVSGTNYVQLTAGDRVAQASTFSFDAATFEIWGSLLNGACLIGIEQDVLLSPRAFAAWLCQQKITTLFLTTALFNQFAREVPGAFGQVRHLLFGGEAVEPKWVREVLRNGPPERLLHVYGPTENTTFSTWAEIKNVPDGAKNLPIGRPIANTQVYVLDQYRQPVPVGVKGEIYIGGDGLARGYLNQAELTVEKFVGSHCVGGTGERLYRTGDLARYLPDGNLEFLGRIDQQVKMRGFRIEPGEIEAVLRQHPAILDAVLIARADAQGSKRLVAYVVFRPESAPEATDLRRFLKGQLPDYMVPTDFAQLKAFPLTPNGKVDRGALPEPETAPMDTVGQLVLPRTPMEAELAAIWCHTIGLKQVGIHDNFFDVGGHSLSAIQVNSRIRESFGVELPLRTLLQKLTVSELAVAIADAQIATESSGEMQRFLAELERLTDDEVARLLASDQDGEEEAHG